MISYDRFGTGLRKVRDLWEMITCYCQNEAVHCVNCVTLQPQILDEYSDPFDVKKEIVQVSKDDAVMRSETQFLNATKDTPQASEDDYSVPYELKTLDGGQ